MFPPLYVLYIRPIWAIIVNFVSIFDHIKIGFSNSNINFPVNLDKSSCTVLYLTIKCFFTQSYFNMCFMQPIKYVCYENFVLWYYM